MKFPRYILLIGILLSIGTYHVNAACDGWFSFSSNCDVKPIYCQDGKCTLSEGVNATKDAIGTQITSKPISQYAQEVVSYLLTFVSIIAVIYIIYGGFIVMTGAGDEEKMKKTKNIILYVIVGIITIWLAFSIVKWVINLVKPGAIVTNINWSVIPSTSAYTESDLDTFEDYQGKIKVALEGLEAELRVNGGVSIANIQNIKSLVQAGYDRLPDNSDYATINSTAKRSVDMYLDIASGSPKSTQKVGDAISKTSAFINGVKIGRISGNISATPSEGNAPLAVSFLANDVIDPSGTTPGSNNYIWWIRENGGVRREIGRGPSLMYTFTQEGTFTVNLDVISGSRNSKGKTDVLPLSISKSISVKPKLGEIILLINGVNVSNLDTIKINPTLGKMGIIFDATASRAIGNGSIVKTSWKFGNGNDISYEGKPIIERQIYGNQGAYNLELQIETNDGKKISKKIQLIVRDPSAVIQTDSDLGNVGDPVHFSALSYFTSSNNNIEYSWQIQDDNNKKVLKAAAGKTLDYTFDTIGKYIVTLTAKSANGNIDSDSRAISIESRAPVINLENPTPISKERPNTIVFDAGKSFDPDTKSSNGLIYTWRINNQKVNLNNISDDGSKGTITFPSVGDNSVSVTVSNAFGKVSTTERKFKVDSILAIDMLVTPQVAPINSTITFIARSENADFYEWNFGDGTPSVSGGNKIIQHTFQKTGNYNISLTVSTKQGGKTNQTQKKIFITDTNSPFAIIDVSNASNTIYEDPNLCGLSGAIVANRSEVTNLSASKSVNIDGSNNNLSYTWNYFGKTKTTPTLSEKFGELGCFPVKLTVRSNKNGAISSTSQMIYLKNDAPEITNISTNIDSTKKDSQKVLVKVTANGAIDKDGVITSYIWYYTTESDKEAQNIQITQKPEITFILPNITEKYYFGVILEDNDGARTNSMKDSIDEQTPLIITNQNGNIYLPLITLSTPQTTIIAGSNTHFTAGAKTIVGTDITNKSEYAWDFDGDGQIDQKTTTSSIDHVYKNSGTYTVKVRVTYNGVSNTKYQTIYVKNELRAHAQGYRLPNGGYYFMNASEGIYDNALWKYTGGSIESPYSVIMEPNIPIQGNTIGTLTVSNNNSESNSIDLLVSDLVNLSSGSGLSYQTSPISKDDTIHLSNASEKILISMLGNVNNATRFAIDTNTSIDSNLDGIPDNDTDNQELPSYNDGSIFVLKDFSQSRAREQKIRLSLYQGNTLLNSKTLNVVFDFMPATNNGSGEVILIDSGSMSPYDKEKLEELASLIRSTDDTSRVILMKSYNIMVENWNDTFAKSKSLIELQSIVDDSQITADKKVSISTVINDLLSGESQSTDDITLAVKLIRGLTSKSSNASTLEEKLSAIESHPQSFEANLILAKEIFDVIQKDSSVDDETKKYIYNQLSVIKNGGGQNIPEETIQTSTSSSGAGVLGLIAGVVKIFGLIILIVFVVILFGYVFYRVSRRNDAIGFQDFLIDSIFHVGSHKATNEISTETTNNQTSTHKETPKVEPKVDQAPIQTTEQELPPAIDPMTVLEQTNNPNQSAPPPVPAIPVSPAESLVIQKEEKKEENTNTLSNIIIENAPATNESLLENVEKDDSTINETPISQPEESANNIPDWLKMPDELEKEDVSQEAIKEPAAIESFHQANDIPDWLKMSESPEEDTEKLSETTKEENSSSTLVQENPVDIITVTPDEDAILVPDSQESSIPSWLVDSVKSTTDDTKDQSTESPKKSTEEHKKKKITKKKQSIAQEKSGTIQNTDNIPDWLK